MVGLEVGGQEDVLEVPTLGAHPFRFVYRPWALWKALREHVDVDVLDIHEEPAALATVEAIVLARLAGCRAPAVCYSAQNLLKRYPPPFRWFERLVLDRVAAVHTCNDDVAAVLSVKGFGGEVVNLGLGVDLDRFRPDSGPAPGEVRDGRLQAGFVGRLTEQKGIFPLLSAIAAADGVELTFVGSGPDEDRLRRAIRARSLDERVTIRGFAAHEDLPQQYRSFDVVVVPSLDRSNVREQFGRVIVEAMACGTPVIASDVGAFPDVVGDAGLVVPDGDVSALADALVRLRDNADLRESLRRRGLGRAHEFSWTRIAERQADLYRRVVRERSPEPCHR